jgi:hypothetical protein
VKACARSQNGVGSRRKVRKPSPAMNILCHSGGTRIFRSRLTFFHDQLLQALNVSREEARHELHTQRCHPYPTSPMTPSTAPEPPTGEPPNPLTPLAPPAPANQPPVTPPSTQSESGAWRPLVGAGPPPERWVGVTVTRDHDKARTTTTALVALLVGVLVVVLTGFERPVHAAAPTGALL